MASMGFKHIQRFAHYHGLGSTAGFGSRTRTTSIRRSHFSRPPSTIPKHWKSHIAYRSPKFAVLTSDHIKSLREILEDDPTAIIDASVQGQSDLDTYNMDWMRKYQGQSQLVLRPRST